MDVKRLRKAALMLAAIAAMSACANEGTIGEDATVSEAASSPWPTEDLSSAPAEPPCAELSTLLASVGLLGFGIASDAVDHGPGAVEDMVPGDSTRSAASGLALPGLMLVTLVPGEVADDVLVLADAGTAITEAIDGGGSLADVSDIWFAPEVDEAEAAVQSYYDGESGCGP